VGRGARKVSLWWEGSRKEGKEENEKGEFKRWTMDGSPHPRSSNYGG